MKWLLNDVHLRCMSDELLLHSLMAQNLFTLLFLNLTCSGLAKAVFLFWQVSLCILLACSPLF